MEDDPGCLKDHIRDIPDFPQPGVVFKDITPLLAHRQALASCIQSLTAPYANRQIDKVIGIEARGFIMAAPVAVALGAGFVPVRKAGKLPWEVHTEPYDLEYGSGALEVHRDAISSGERVLIVDDVLATGGTAEATARLVSKLGGEPAGFACVIELAFLRGRERLGNLEAVSLLKYE